MTRLLMDEKPLMVLPSLAVLVGVNGAISLQQCHWVCQIKEEHQDYRTEHEGHIWCNYTYGQWQSRVLPWLSVRSVGKTLRELEDKGFLISCKPNKKEWNHSKWYRVNHDALKAAGRNFLIDQEETSESERKKLPNLDQEETSESSYIKKDLKKDLYKETGKKPEKPEGKPAKQPKTSSLASSVFPENQLGGLTSSERGVLSCRGGRPPRSNHDFVAALIAQRCEDVNGFLEWRGQKLANTDYYKKNQIKVTNAVVLQFYAKRLISFGSDAEKAQAIANLENQIRSDIDQWPQRRQDERGSTQNDLYDQIDVLHKKDPLAAYNFAKGRRAWNWFLKEKEKRGKHVSK